MLAGQLEERRLFSRFDVRAPLLLEVAGREPCVVETINLSRSGVFLRTDARIVVGQRCTLRIPREIVVASLPTRSDAGVVDAQLVVPEQQIAGNAVRIVRPDGNPSPLVHVAIEFATPLFANEVRDIRDRPWRPRSLRSVV